MAISSPLLSICPRVRKVKGALVARTNLTLRILSLGLMNRKVRVDRNKEEVTISRRLFWFYPRRRRIPFAHIEAVTYSYQDWAADSWTWAHDSVDLFSVGLRLHGGGETHLFYFYGDGTFQNDGPLPDWWYWEEFLTDFSGTQERESKLFVDVLSKMIGVTVAPGRD